MLGLHLDGFGLGLSCRTFPCYIHVEDDGGIHWTNHPETYFNESRSWRKAVRVNVVFLFWSFEWFTPFGPAEVK